METSTSEGKRGIHWRSRMQLDDLDFADDLALLLQSQQQMQEKTISVAAAPAAVGLNIHKGKGKIIRYNTACINPVTIDGEDLEDVHEHGGSDADVKARIGKTRAAYLRPNNIWNSKQLSVNPHQDTTTTTTITTTNNNSNNNNSNNNSNNNNGNNNNSTNLYLNTDCCELYWV
ncbi:unnamed protein product [Schistosoma margrebowiei]|uniref:Uncharacterized protein n=1 Tax=Schistosoma margrebowiei TaxID=48269 RepID=A0A183ME34_9TREM|nr:unnamed protein product [Schistosoma margrebowiei]